MTAKTSAQLKAAFPEQNPADFIVDLVDSMAGSAAGVTASPAELNILDGVTATTAEINKLSGSGAVVASGTAGTTVAAIVPTFTLNDPGITPNGALTIADGSTPTVSELLEYCEELNAKIAALSALLDAFGISA